MLSKSKYWIYVFSGIMIINTTTCGSQKEKNMETSSKTTYKYTNHLIDETSPYLLEHAHNPVNWYPWGKEALEKAQREDKPIFLSIGYSSCHWCHVMEHESFENEEIAALLNKYFVSIKVDREQRPDLDQIYMSFTTALTGRGGWPMSVFLTPDLKPFYAGTYFPPDDRYGKPGFKKIITEIGKAYIENKQSILNASANIYSQVSQRLQTNLPAAVVTQDMIKQAVTSLMNNFDNVYGGFGQAPKFPHAVELSLLLRYYKATGDTTYLEATLKSLRAMAKGGIYDQLGGGFARYSTDRQWLVPHFEKMLYTNVLLVLTYVDAYQITGDDFYLQVVRGILDFILREMTDKNGGFYSSLDADSDGKEGKFYVWSKTEIDQILGKKAELFERYYNITERGNFENENILSLTEASDNLRDKANLKDFDNFISDSKEKLMQVRSRRIRPKTDDKILTSWNGLALSAFCKGYQVTQDARYLKAALKNASFVKERLYQNRQLTHAYRQGKHSSGQFLEDYAYYIKGLLDLYETDTSDNNGQWLKFADELASHSTKLFMNESGHFYLRPASESDLIVRPKDETDGAIPAPGSIMIADLLKLNRFTGKNNYLKLAEKGLQAISGQIKRYPSQMASALLAVDYYLNDKIEIVIVGKGKTRDEMLDVLYRRFIPDKIIALSNNGDNSFPLFEGRKAKNNGVKAYVCRNSVCNLPVSTVQDLKKELKGI